MKNLINIGIPSKGRLRKDVLKIFTKKRLRIQEEQVKEVIHRKSLKSF